MYQESIDGPLGPVLIIFFAALAAWVWRDYLASILGFRKPRRGRHRP